MGGKRYREQYKIGRKDKGKRRMKLRKKEKIKKKAKKKEKIEKKKDHDKKTAKWIRKTEIQNEKRRQTSAEQPRSGFPSWLREIVLGTIFTALKTKGLPEGKFRKA